VPPYILIAPSPTSPLYATVSCIISDSKGYISVLDKKFQVEKKWKGWAGDDDETHVGGKGKGKGKEKEKGVMLLECGGVLLGIGVSFPSGYTHNPVTNEPTRTGGRIFQSIPDVEDLGLDA
jgi:hypothetical protein